MRGSAEPFTSTAIGTMMEANPLVVRRALAGLRDAGILIAVKGHGGGWLLARDPREVTVAEVYDALGAPVLFGIGNRRESPGCLVEQAVNRALTASLKEAEAALRARLQRLTLAQLGQTVRRSAARRST